jgi:dCTP diphosphatase
MTDQRREWLRVRPDVLPIADIQDRQRTFATARDWEQFHSSKNLVMALAAEAAELLEIFQWIHEDRADSHVLENAATHVEVAAEIADILIYALQLADRLQIDVVHAVDDKFTANERRYPEAAVRGSATKYTKRPPPEQS